jgi:hypothetical protein
VWPAPALSPGDIVVIDDLDSHKSPESAIHTQTIEGFWSIFKRGVVGMFHR